MTDNENGTLRSEATSATDFDVIIVGLGPVGGTLAALLGNCGVSVLVLDRDPVSYHLPRAVHFDDEVMRVFQSIGIAKEVEANTLSNLGMKFVDADGRLLLDWPRRQVLGEQGWKASYRFHQPDLERVLRGSLQRHPTVELRTRCEVFFVDDRGADVEVRYEDLANGRICSVTAKYTVGCDGARSLVRRFIGSEMEDLGFHERWLVVDVLLNGEKPELGDATIQHCDPARPSTYVRGPGNRRRWEITVHENEDSNEVAKPESVWRLLEPWLRSDEAEFERATVYTFHSLIAEKWRSGRLLLAGDSAHQTPPFMGQGMCAGIRDAANLAWKLALCVSGKADESLLTSYQSERHAHVEEYIKTAIRLGNLINASSTEAGLRDGLYREDGATEMDSIIQRLGDGLAAGETSRAGYLFSQLQLPNGTWMDDAIGYASVLLADDELWSNAEKCRKALKEKGIRCVTTADVPVLADQLAAIESKAVMLRPDRYILGTASDFTSLSNLIDETPPSPILN